LRSARLRQRRGGGSQSKQFQRFATSQAMAVVFIAVLLVLILVQTRVLERQVHYT